MDFAMIDNYMQLAKITENALKFWALFIACCQRDCETWPVQML